MVGLRAGIAKSVWGGSVDDDDEKYRSGGDGAISLVKEGGGEGDIDVEGKNSERRSATR